MYLTDHDQPIFWYNSGLKKQDKAIDRKKSSGPPVNANNRNLRGNTGLSGKPMFKIKHTVCLMKKTTGIFFRDHQNINFAIQ